MKLFSLRGGTVVVTLAVFWLLIAVWQADEHRRVRRSSRQILLNHGSDIVTSLEVVLRSQARFAAVSRDRLEAALEALSTSSELLTLAVLSPGGEVVSSAGRPLPPDVADLPAGTQQWHDETLTVVELIQLPSLVTSESADPGEGEEAGIVVIERFPRPGPPFSSSRRREGDDQEGGSPPPPQEAREPGSPAVQPAKSPPDVTPETAAPNAPPPDATHTPGEPDEGIDETERSRRDGRRRHWEQREERKPEDMTEEELAEHEARQRFRKWMREHGRRGERPRYPPWLSEEQYKTLYDQAGLQRFLLVLSARDVRSQIVRDFWERAGLVLAALLALSAVWFGWRSLQRATKLGLRLVRAQEMNTHLREMNTAAAGLAHETRNPLNSVRGLAQMIASDSESGSQSRNRARTVMAEVDRINSRLGEFLAYSRPKPPCQAAVDLSLLVSDVLRTLETDREEKRLSVETSIPPVPVLADEGQFRQVLFNLLLNAYQASPEGGTVWVEAAQQDDGLTVAIRDCGPGVPEDAREDIFRPYFVLTEQGTGLGLAVTRQIVLAHHWDIECLGAPGGGAEFRIRGIQQA